MALQNAFQDLATDQRLDQTNALLRRLVKIMESQATVDAQNRQRVTIDAITGNLTLTTLTGITNALPAGANNIGGITTIAGVDHKQYIDIARTAFNTGLRSKLT